MTNFVGRLGVTLGLDSAEFTRGIEGAKRSLQSVGTFAQQYGAIAATAFAAATVAAARYADELVDVARANDVAISSIIQLRDALAKSGGEAGNASKFLSSFTQYIDKAAEGSFEAQKTLKGLGISLQDLQSLDVETLFRKAASGLAAMDDALKRSAKGMDVFGKSFKGVDARDFNESLKTGTKLTKEHEEGIKAAAEAYDNLAEMSRRAMEKMASIVGPTMKFITSELNKLFLESKKFEDSDLWKMLFPQIRTGAGKREKPPEISSQPTPEDIAGMANSGAPVPPPARRIVKPGVDKDAEAAEKKRLDAILKRFKAEEEAREQMRQSQAEMDAYNTQQTEKQIQEQEDLFRRRVKAMFEEQAQYEQNQRELDDYNRQQAEKQIAEQDALFALRVRATLEEQRQKEENQREQDEYNDRQQQKELDDIKRRQEIRANALRREAEEIEEGNRLLAEQQGQYSKTNAALFERQQLDSETIRRQKVMLELADQNRYVQVAQSQLLQEMLGIEWKYADEKQEILNNQLLTDTARADALKRLIALQEQELDVAKQRFQIAEKYQKGTFGQGFEDAMKMSMANATTTFEMGQKAFESLMTNMESAISKFVQTGKLSFKDLTRSIIADLIAIQLKAQATALFSRMISGMFGPSMAYSSATSYASTAAQGWLGFADGGEPPVNKPSIVGERGPELFVPKTAGTIVPNHQLASIMGTGQTINYNAPIIQNMSAIDTQSGLEFLSRNKQAVWAANQSAQRSLPVNR